MLSLFADKFFEGSYYFPGKPCDNSNNKESVVTQLIMPQEKGKGEKDIKN